LPRTCVDDPCHAALTQQELSQLTGTDPRIPRFAKEWNDYYARYADYCRKETTPNGEAVALSPQDFWDRTRRRSQVAQTIAGVSPVLPQSLLIDLSPTTKNGVTAGILWYTAFPPHAIWSNGPLNTPTFAENTDDKDQGRQPNRRA